MSFNFEFTVEQVEELLPGNKDYTEWYDVMKVALPLYEINTVERVAGFIAQCGHESRNFGVLTENLNYSASALNKIFPKYFTRAGRSAQQYHRQPERIANVIYANRMGNSDPGSGDGWRFRGGGLIQLTGKRNYTAFAESIDISLDDAVDYVRTIEGALVSACWFWKTNNINKYCDRLDIETMTRRINGGTIGLEDRKKHWEHALDVLGGDYEEYEPIRETIRKGSRGPFVVEVQEAMDIHPADGIFGPGTERIVKDWQTKNGLIPDGILGPKSLEVLLGENTKEYY